MRRLLIFCEYAILNGAERSMLSTLDAAGRAGFDLIVAAPPKGPLAEAISARGIEVHPFQVTDAAGRRPEQAVLRDRMADVLRRVRPALVHANSLAMGRLAGPVLAAQALPSLAHLRDILRLSAQAVADLNRHTRLLAVSEAVRKFHVAQGVDASRLYVLHNGVDLVEFSPRPARGYLHRELELPPQARLLGTIAQIGLRKGQDLLVRAAPRIVAAFPDVHFLVIGQRHSDKPEARQFEDSLHRTAEHVAPGRFHFLGIRGDVPWLLNELTLLVHPARQEPLGRVLLEAAASGVAVVAADVGGTAEIFPSSATAALIPSDDPDSLAREIARLLADEPARCAMAAAARRRAEEAFEVHCAAAALVEHYRAVVSGRSSAVSLP